MQDLVIDTFVMPAMYEAVAPWLVVGTLALILFVFYKLSNAFNKKNRDRVAMWVVCPVVLFGLVQWSDAGDLVDAVHQVETSGRLGPILGDGGDALGPLQIHRGCWIDAGLPGRYEDCADLAYSTRVFHAYMARYATVRRLGRPVTDQDRARIWNGGPNGYKKTATIKYWTKVQKELNNG